ncbi:MULTISPECIES: cytochrome c551 [Paenisporosarcina]|jgi:cytochrome c551|uniref:C-type cytochrome n=1 Tax=Paenisporosarcina quisquiliarum TaxID=365346 RepID=A0A9X3RDN0_9BACL|nr:cytochrome c [Paenisporosarcina quisquiliarum]MCZ8536612.1 c-type cytochrome [Paenisporosarcina quisquiliarum]
MNKKLLAAIFGSALMLAACGGGGDEEATETNEEKGGEVTETQDAEKIVQGNCTSCHGGNLEGQGNFPSLKDVGSRLSKDEILQVIQNGQGQMPANIIEGAEAEVVAEWLANKK